MINIFPIILLALAINSQNINVQGDKPNDFRIGIFGMDFSFDEMNNPVSSPFLPGTTHPSSDINVYVQHGVNTIQDYRVPSAWVYEDRVVNVFMLINNINSYYGSDLKLMTNSKSYFKPYHKDSKEGENIYNNISSEGETGSGKQASNKFKPRPHYDHMIELCSQQEFRNMIWGHQLSEEAAYFHPFNFSMDAPNKNNYVQIEVPPANVGSALNYFKKALATRDVYDQKLVLMEGYHGRAVLPGATETEGIYFAPDYLPILAKNDPRDVWFEGSYSRWEGSKWFRQEYSRIFKPGNMNYHFLGKYESIEHAKEFTDNVQKVYTVSLSRPSNGKIGWDPITYYRYHTDLDIKNANFIWLQVYTAIIHDVDGIWFWNPKDCWDRNDPDDVARNKMRIDKDPERFEEENFYSYYTNYLGPIIKEMRYLVNHDLISTNENIVLYSKTTDEDESGILSDPKSYIFEGNHDGNWDLLKQTEDNHQSEVYGLRYTIRTNGSETIMIIVNPLAVPIESVWLDFSGIRNPRIQVATGVHLLFKGDALGSSFHYPDIKSKNYKTIRRSDFDFDTPIDQIPHVDISEDYNFKKKDLFLRFGPLDIHVIRFIR